MIRRTTSSTSSAEVRLRRCRRFFHQLIIQLMELCTTASVSRQPHKSPRPGDVQVLPFFESKAVTLQCVLTDRGTEFCGRLDENPYELYLAVNDIDHTR